MEERSIYSVHLGPYTSLSQADIQASVPNQPTTLSDDDTLPKTENPTDLIIVDPTILS